MTTRIDKLELVNFRSFRDLSMTFHPELTVLVAPNGGDKTAILDGLATALYQYVYAIRNKNESHPIDPKDVRIGGDPRAPASMRTRPVPNP
jgi:predicted ATP-binding protein involved in virulence